MTRKLFGTDGIRGKANVEPMTAETALRVAMAAGRHFTRGDHRHLAVIGKDTRLSNYMLEPAMQSGSGWPDADARRRHADTLSARRCGRHDFGLP